MVADICPFVDVVVGDTSTDNQVGPVTSGPCGVGVGAGVGIAVGVGTGVGTAVGVGTGVGVAAGV